MFLRWSSTKIVQAIWIRQKTWRQGSGLIFPIYLYRKLQKSSCQKPLDRFQYTFAEKFLWWSSTKIVQAIWIRKKNMAARGAGLIFPIHLYRKLYKSSCQKPLDRFQYNFAEMFLWWSSTKIVQAIWNRQKNMAARGRGLFSLYIYIEIFKNLLVRNHWTDFNIILQKCFFGDPLPRLFKPFGLVKKIWPPGGRGLFSLCIYIENFKNLLVRNHWMDFNIILQKRSFGNPLPRLFKPFGFVKKHGRLICVL